MNKDLRGRACSVSDIIVELWQEGHLTDGSQLALDLPEDAVLDSIYVSLVSAIDINDAITYVNLNEAIETFSGMYRLDKFNGSRLHATLSSEILAIRNNLDTDQISVLLRDDILEVYFVVDPDIAIKLSLAVNTETPTETLH